MNKSDLETAPVLVVDMDGTLFRNDTMHEALAALLATRPLDAVQLIGPLSSGKTAWKRALADKVLANASDMQVRPEVVDEINAAKAAGRKIALVSASDDRQVQRVAAELGLFDEAFGTGPRVEDGANLGGSAKAAFLIKRYGEGGFDYIGDSKTDAPVWAAAREAIVAGDDKAAHAVAATQPRWRALRGEAQGTAPLVKAMRPHQWAKNALIFVPLLAGQQFGGLGAAILAFIAFSLIASSVYLFNDIIDLKADRTHPRKRHRPFASGAASLQSGAFSTIGLFGAGMLIAFLLLPGAFVAILLIYYALTLGYSLFLKRRMIIDIWVLAGLYTVRIVAGGVATGVMLSPWLLTFAMFLFLGLAAIKRQAELTDMAHREIDQAAGRAYVVSDLPIIQSIAIAAGYASVLVFALYINSLASAEIYSGPEFLWGVCPVLLFWFTNMVMITHRGGMNDDPLLFAVRDKTSLACGGVVGIFFMLATFAP